MQGSIREVARLGLVHHMLYPHGTDDAGHHAATLKAFVARQDIETFDCCLPLANAAEDELISAVKEGGKANIVYATHLFPLRKLGLSSPADGEQGVIRTVLLDMVRQASAIGACGFIFASGGPAPEQADEAHYRSFRELCRWLCEILSEHGIEAMLEPFDTDVDKCFLYGATQQCVDLIESLRPQVTNFGIELDIAHLPLMNEKLDVAIRTVAPYLRRVHLGNCVLKDRSHPRYGDTHPPIGFPGGEIDIPQLVQVLRALLDIGYLDSDQRGDLIIEMTPWPGRTVEDTIQDAFKRLDDAWKQT